jgi:outer membrane protein
MIQILCNPLPIIRGTARAPRNLGFAHKRSIVKGVVRSLILGVAATMALAAAPAWAELKIGYVNFNALLAQSPDAKVVSDQLSAEFLPRNRDLQTLSASLKAREDKLAKDGATMTDDQRTREDKDLRDGERELQRKQTEMTDDLNARRNEDLSTLQKSLVAQVQVYAKAQNYDLIIVDSVVYATAAVDITQQVLASLQAKVAKPAPGDPAAGK